MHLAPKLRLYTSTKELSGEDRETSKKRKEIKKAQKRELAIKKRHNKLGDVLAFTTN